MEPGRLEMRMIPETPSELERRRFVVLTVMRAGGVVMMLIGLWIMLGDLLQDGDKVGGAIFIVGAVESLLLPALLASKWRSPPRP